MSIIKLYFGRKIPGLWKTSRKIALRGHTLLRELGIISQGDMDLWQKIDTKGLTTSTIRGIMRRMHRLGVVEHPKILSQLKLDVHKELNKLRQSLDDYYLTVKKAYDANFELRIILDYTQKIGLTDLAKACSGLIDAFHKKEKDGFPWQLAEEEIHMSHPQVPKDLSQIEIFARGKERFSRKEMALIFNTHRRGLNSLLKNAPGHTIASYLKELAKKDFTVVVLHRKSDETPWEIEVTVTPNDEELIKLSPFSLE